jgi:hypothetical protein
MGAHFEAQRIRPRGSVLRRHFAAPPAAVRQVVTRVALWVLIALLGAALVGLLACHFLIAPRLTVRRILLQGDTVLSEQEICAAAGISLGERLLTVDTERTRALLEACPAVKRATVSRQLPETLVVVLEGRRALATALVPTPEGTVPVVFDEEGLIFRAGAGAAEADVPVISGLGFARWQPGTKLPAVLQPLLDDLRKLRTEEPGLFAFISEVVVKRAGERDVEVMIYPSTYSTPIRAGGRIPADLLKNAALLLDVVRRERLEDRVREVDLRAREVVYREKSGG